jgi:hypothetical protein
MLRFPFAIALMMTGEFRNGDVAKIAYLLPNFSTTSPTSVNPTIALVAAFERAPSTAAMVEDVLFEDDSSDDESPSKGDDCGGLTATTNEDVPGKMC